MSAESAIEKLQIIAKEKEAEMETRGGNGIIEKKRSIRGITKSRA
jgi:hypothetical protein